MPKYEFWFGDGIAQLNIHGDDPAKESAEKDKCKLIRIFEAKDWDEARTIYNKLWRHEIAKEYESGPACEVPLFGWGHCPVCGQRFIGSLDEHIKSMNDEIHQVLGVMKS